MDKELHALLRELVDLNSYAHKKNYEIDFLTYPFDGTRATIATGTTIIDFEHGIVKAPDGAITKLSTSLDLKKKDFLRSVAVNADIDIIVQMDESNKIPVRADNWFVATYQQFRKLKITTTASTTVFTLACTNPEAVLEMVGETTVSVGKEERNQIASDKDTQFTSAIATNAIESENLTGLSDNEITITGIAFQAKENLHYRLLIFETDGFADTDLAADQFVEYVDFDLPTNGARIAGAGQYYYARTGLNIDYEDLDASKELHVSLQNLSAAGKTAGANGEVKARVSYVPRT